MMELSMSTLPACHRTSQNRITAVFLMKTLDFIASPKSSVSHYGM